MLRGNSAEEIDPAINLRRRNISNMELLTQLPFIKVNNGARLLPFRGRLSAR